jgi:hypothetical protein
MKTLRPVFSTPEEDDALEAAVDDVDELVEVVELDDDDEHAASRIDTMASGTASPVVCLSFIS